MFVGGMVRGLLITDPGVAAARPTKDVDLVVDAASLVDYYAVCDVLRDRGLVETAKPDAPICRRVVDGVLVDVMPTDPVVLGFSNVWYPDAIANATTVVVDGVSVPLVDPVHFCATKLEAWLSRGRDDFWHHDLEDLIAVVDGRVDLLDAIASASDAVRDFIGRTLEGLLSRADFVEALPGHLGPDAASQARLPVLMQRLQAIAAMRPAVPPEAEPEPGDGAGLVPRGTTAPPAPATAPWISVRSSNVRAIRYDEGTSTLFVEFRTGHIYAYDRVPATVFAALRGAGSKGSFLARWIKGRYGYRRLR